MNNKGRLTALLFACSAFMILHACRSETFHKPSPRVEKGVIDLRGWRFAKDGPIALDGEWDFYWHMQLKPGDFSGEHPPALSGFIKVPGTWNGYEVNGRKIPGTGYATYRLKILLPQAGQKLAFKFLDMAVAFSVYVNGKLLMSAGIPGKTRESTRPQFYPQVVEYKPDSRRLNVIIQVSNFYHRKGGAWESILLGLNDDVRQIRQRALNFTLFLFGGILIMGIYHISLYIFRPQDKSALFFAIFCFLIAVRSLVTGERYLIELWPNFNWEAHTKLAYLTFYFAVPVFAAYARNIFPKEVSKKVIYFINVVGALFSAIVIFTPARIFTYTAPVFQIFTILVFGYGFYILILAIHRKRLGARLYLVGYSVLFLTGVNDILYSNLLIETGYMIPFGLFVFIFSQAVLLSLRFSRAFATVESQQLTLQDTIKAYKNEILERERTEDALRESEEKYRQLVENANEAIVVAQNGRLCFVNARAVELSGYSEAELKSNPFIDWVHPEERELIRQNYLKRISGEPVPANYTIRFLHKSGSVKWVQVSAVRISWEGSPATLNFLSDITEKRLLEHELMKAQKLESIGILAGGIAHDFNNILASIMGNISLAKLDAGHNNPTYNYLDNAEKASRRATGLTQQLLTFSRGGAPVKKVASISDVITDCAKFVLSGSKVKCEFNLPTELWPVEIDVDQISQVIQNIIINADQAMPGGGIIQISADNLTVGADYGLPLSSGRYVRIAIRDLGCGIAEENLNKIFDPYFTTKQDGTGLGLATAYSIIKRHDGHIGVKSQLGVGTTFTVYLPSSKADAIDAVENRRDPVPGGGKVLAMDDEDMIRDLIRHMLHRMGYEAEVARDGEEAVHLYRQALEEGRPFDAVILDLTVPGAMGGKETLDKLQAIDPNVKAIVSSGYSNDPILSNYKKYGFSGVVTKPFNLQNLGETLKSVLM